MSCALGMLVWLAAPLGIIGEPPSFGSLEHVFTFMPLVAAPLAMLLLVRLLDAGNSAEPLSCVVAQRLQPLAAALVLASFFFPKGVFAGGLAVGWLLVTILLAVGGVRGLKLQAGAHLSNVSLLAAQVFLPIGAGWLLLSRLGVGPRNLTGLTVFLGAIHFHFSGFVLQLLIAATGRKLPDPPSRLGGVHRCLAIGAIAGIPLIAAGNIAPWPALKFIGVASMVFSTIGLATTSAAVALNARSRTASLFLFVSAGSLATGMGLAGAYGIGELSRTAWLGIPHMVATHGLLNALGFTACGLTGHLLLHLRRPQQAA